MPDRPIIVSPAPFKAPKVINVPDGFTIYQIIGRMGLSDPHLMVEVDGIPVPPDRWHEAPPVGSHVLISVPVHGGSGKDPLRILLTVAVIVAATVAGQYYGAAIAGSLGVTSAAGIGTVTALTTLAGTTAGMLLINAIAPIRAPELSGGSDYAQSNTYSLQGARNSSNPWGPVPVVLGKHKVYPPFGATPYTEISGNDEYLRLLFIWGYGPLKIENICIGETPLANYSDYEIETREGRVADTDLTLIPSVVHQDAVGVEVTQAGGAIVRNAREGADELSIDIIFPVGLCDISNVDGSRLPRTVVLTLGYREIGVGSWTEVTLTYTDRVSSAMRYGYRWTVDRTKQYEVSVTRVSVDNTGNDLVIDRSYWSMLRSFTNDHPVDFPVPLAMSALRIRASEQLQGVIDSLNAIVTTYATIWNGSAWSGEAATQNPAALYRSVLMSAANSRTRTAAQIDDDALGDWYEFCATEGYKFNMVRDFKSSVWAILADIAAAGRAAPSLTDGKWGVVMDDGNQAVVQHITPRNSWGFASEKILFDRPHGFRCRFLNEDADYQQDERIVYDDGYTSANATVFEGMELPGITDPDLVWKFGRYQIAQARLRPEQYSLYMDFEHLVCRRGSKVRVSHDIPLWGSGWGRVKTLSTSGSDTTGVILDEYVVMEAGKSYGCRFRLADSGNTSLVLSVVTVVGETNTLTFQTPVATATGPQEGDLAMFGETDSETVELLVKSIDRAGDYTARLSLVDVASAIYDADTGDIPDFDTHITQPVDITKLAPAAPTISNIESGTAALEVFGGVVRPRIFVTVSPGTGNVRISTFRVQYRESGSALWMFAETPVNNPTVIISNVFEGATYEIQAQAVSIYGVESPWSASSLEPVIGQEQLPSDVTGFACNIIGSSAYLSWIPVSDLDLSHYVIRISPETSGATWVSATVLVERVGKPASSITVPAMVGTYLIKAVDYVGNESDSAAVISTSIARVSGLNFVDSVVQPAWSGVASGADYDAGLGGIALVATGGVFPASGYYQLADVIDLLGIFTVRASAYLTINGQNVLTDLYDFADLYAVGNLYGVSEGQYTASLEISTSDIAFSSSSSSSSSSSLSSSSSSSSSQSSSSSSSSLSSQSSSSSSSSLSSSSSSSSVSSSSSSSISSGSSSSSSSSNSSVSSSSSSSSLSSSSSSSSSSSGTGTRWATGTEWEDGSKWEGE